MLRATILYSLALLGEVDLLAGQIVSPRTPPDFIASVASVIPKPGDWIVPGTCAYVPQVMFSSIIMATL